MDGQYSWNRPSQEVWGNTTFDTREEALAEGQATWPGEPIETCRFERYKADTNDFGEIVLDRMAEWAYDNCGEAAEDWLTVEVEDLHKLDAALSNVIQKWLDETCNNPDFYRCVDIQSHQPEQHGC